MTLVRMYVYARKKQEAMKIFENVFHNDDIEPLGKSRRKFDRSAVYRRLHKYAARYLLCLYNTHRLSESAENLLG